MAIFYKITGDHERRFLQGTETRFGLASRSDEDVMAWAEPHELVLVDREQSPDFARLASPGCHPHHGTRCSFLPTGCSPRASNDPDPAIKRTSGGVNVSPPDPQFAVTGRIRQVDREQEFHGSRRRRHPSRSLREQRTSYAMSGRSESNTRPPIAAITAAVLMTSEARSVPLLQTWIFEASVAVAVSWAQVSVSWRAGVVDTGEASCGPVNGRRVLILRSSAFAKSMRQGKRFLRTKPKQNRWHEDEQAAVCPPVQSGVWLYGHPG